ncbi:3' terminal RNA ribose 2'-O-methyltransferase Hen1 [Gordonia sp. PDNC005]|uniref:3' terminal RNA ribose 2'-O-methyltransferase Hen1 n=1 Tax=unclassified Gordonia (in: high G+C Gram-positive bacteria) TaxID=2657482 RepID=UPI001965A897|nr:3' terminal RNA ribose 2'-O-methyltransferase Hen1 [Gordonia sp. PDNC005]QRY62901.1 3' terminal RNA ribose 2'-O-methyltransferase Hen1 [Gordonia sp. PDNC005]
MILTISTTHQPATDLGFLLHKHPDRVQTFSESFGSATVFYPDADEDRCTVALMLDVDPIALARSRGRRSPDFALAQYVNDRPYAATSLLAVALGRVFRTARTGRCDSRQALADSVLPLEVTVPVLPCHGGQDLARMIFSPLGWEVDADPIILDPAFPDWGDSKYVRLHLKGDVRLADAVNQLYVLLPAFDSSKHYWQDSAEVDKLLRAGGDWLASHPARDTIVSRYLARTSGLTGVARARLAELDDAPGETPEDLPLVPRSAPLNQQRHDAVLAEIDRLRPDSVIDFGCGSGRLLAKLLRTNVSRVAGCDVSTRELTRAAEHLHVENMTERQSARLDLFQAALTYVDERFSGYDVAILMEVIEHLDLPRLDALEHVLFGVARPGAVVVTTPNVEYNVRYEGLVGTRHPDHRFEWTRAEFAAWADRVAADNGYRVDCRGIGDTDPTLGSPTQMAVFSRD